MQDQHTSPLGWVQAAVLALQWPVIVVAAFWLGRYVHGLEVRVLRAETRLEQLLERHMPAIHKMLAEIRGLLVGARQ
jgi:hypothetical protein